jgi:serine/threonine protein kinase
MTLTNFSATSHQLIGEIIDGKYHVENKLAEGGMGAVYKATHLGTKRPVALKVIAPHLVDRAEFVERFKREAEAAGRLIHPNVINVTDFGFATVGRADIAYLVMEYLEGSTLGELLKGDLLSKKRKLPLDFVLDIVQQICLAMDKAHSQGVIHRDLKPDNIWLEPNGRGGYNVKILDFGIAKITAIHQPTVLQEAATLIIPEMPEQISMDGSLATAQTILFDGKTTAEERNPATVEGGLQTQFGAVLGTPLYMSPEQCVGAQLTPKSDIYSLGVIVYQMLAGEPPFGGDTITLVKKHKEISPPRLKEKRPDVTQGLEDVLLSALAKRPEDRPQSALAFATAFSATAESEIKVIREAKYYYNTFMSSFLSVSLIVYLPFILLTILLRVGFAQMQSAKCELAFMGYLLVFFFIVLLANKLNVAACTLIVKQLRSASQESVQIKTVLATLVKHLPALVITSLQSNLRILIGLLKFIRPGVRAYVGHALFPAVIVLEGAQGTKALDRSTFLLGRLRSLASMLQARDFGFSLGATLLGPAFIAGMSLIFGEPFSRFESVPFFKFFGVLYCWMIIVLGHSMYSAIPLGLLYFRSRQAHGETLDEAFSEEVQFEEKPQRAGQHNKVTVAWLVIPFLILAMVLYALNVSQTDERALLEAARRGHAQTIKRLLATGIKTETRSPGGMTALMLASRNGTTDSVRELIGAGADVNAVDDEGMTSLIYASWGDQAEVINLLLVAGAHVNAKDDNGETALISAAMRGHSTAVRALIQAGADVNIKDEKGKSALNYAQEEGHHDVVQLLIGVTSL